MFAEVPVVAVWVWGGEVERESPILDAEVLTHGSCILIPLLSTVGRFLPLVCHLSNLDVSAVVVSI